MLTSGCPSDFHHVQTTALHAHIQWSTACTHLVVHRMHTSSGPPDAAHPVVHRMRHIRWTTSGTFPDAWGCDIRWSTGGQLVDHRMWRSPVYISYPTLSASLTHYIRQCVSIFYVDARVSPCVLPLTRWHAHVFSRNRGGFEQVVLLVFVLKFSTLCRIKIISFCSFKNGKIILIYLQWLSGMINSLLGALGCRIRIISSLGTSYTGSASGLTVYMSSSTRYNPYPTPAYLITNNIWSWYIYEMKVHIKYIYYYKFETKLLLITNKN